jgi:hypothetical protein
MTRKTSPAPPSPAPPSFLDSVIILLVSTGLALFLLWAASRIEGATPFDQLPDWLKSSYSAIWGLILSGTGLGLAVIKALTRKDQATFNYLLGILGTTAFLLAAISLLTYLFKPRVLPQGTEAKVPEPSSPPKADPVYGAWLGIWDDDTYPNFSRLEVFKVKETEKLVGQLDVSRRNTDGTKCDVSYRLDFSQPYYLEGLTFEGHLVDTDGSCPEFNPDQTRGAIMGKGKDTLELTIDNNPNIETHELFTKTFGPCTLWHPSIFSTCIPDPSAPYHTK